MKIISNLLLQFIDDVQLNNVKENFEEFEIVVNAVNIKIPSETELIKHLKGFPERDKIVIRISYDDIEPHTLRSAELDIAEFIKSLKNSVEIKDANAQFIIKITINKTKSNNAITIYSFSNFAAHLNKQSFKGLSFEFNKIINKSEYILFNLLEDVSAFNTATLYFTNVLSDAHPIVVNRVDLIKLRNNSCRFIYMSDNNLLPSDFYLINKSNNDLFNNVMNKLSLIYSLIFIANNTEIIKEPEEKINFGLEGYKVVNNSFLFQNIDSSSFAEYFKIYEWVYNGGNINDKICLSRNIITIHLKDKQLTLLEDGTLSSIYSSYELYLKENVEQYIQIKNKIAEFLIELSQKTGDTIKSFSDTFKSNLFSFLTFFITVIVMNSLSDKKLNNIFTRDITMLSIGLIGLSILFLFYSIFEVKLNIKRFTQTYYCFKNRYTDLLDKVDIEKIFNKDYDYKKDIEFINEYICTQIRHWIYTNVIVLVTIFLLSESFAPHRFILSIPLNKIFVKIINFIY